MNILFLTLSQLYDLNESDMYADLMREFVRNGHNVYVVTPFERKMKRKTRLYNSNGANILGVRTLNIQKTNIIEKGLGTLLIEYQYMKAINKYLGNIKFDLVTYSTPPITFNKVIEWAKKKYGAKSYLQLKDIFPQNAVDLGMMSKTGVKGILYKLFRKKEERMYELSDFIGCMSPANVKYVIEHNPGVNPNKVELAPNSIMVSDNRSAVNEGFKNEIRQKYGLPCDKPIFIYGGNLGKPQGVPHLIKCLEENKNRTDCHFVIIGSGTELPKLLEWSKNNQGTSVTVMKGLPKADYDALAASCDAGLIFLDYRFTIPNYPSRLLAYLQERKPIIACTDPNCDTGSIAEANGYGYWCPSNNVDTFTKTVDKMLSSDMKAMGEKGYQYLLDNYTVEHTYNAIMKHFGSNDNVNENDN